MKNEDKAKQIARNIAYNLGNKVCNDIKTYGYEDVYNAALQAMELKDKEWADRFQKAFEGLWTASFNVDTLSSKIETTIEFKHVARE